MCKLFYFFVVLIVFIALLKFQSYSTSTLLLSRCQTQFSRYTCPHCNLHYCNLVCFRSNKHINCSENFDRINLLEEINSSKDKTNEEKKGMLELLKRFEEEAAAADASGVEGEAGDENDEEEGEIDEERKLLEEKLEGIDLGNLTWTSPTTF